MELLEKMSDRKERVLQRSSRHERSADIKNDPKASDRRKVFGVSREYGKSISIETKSQAKDVEQTRYSEFRHPLTAINRLRKTLTAIRKNKCMNRNRNFKFPIGSSMLAPKIITSRG